MATLGGAGAVVGGIGDALTAATQALTASIAITKNVGQGTITGLQTLVKASTGLSVTFKEFGDKFITAYRDSDKMAAKSLGMGLNLVEVQRRLGGNLAEYGLATKLVRGGQPLISIWIFWIELPRTKQSRCRILLQQL